MPLTATILDPSQWTPRAVEHETRARAFGEPFVDRRMKGKKHPIEDFLFTYYTQKPGQLYRWHPGMAVVLVGHEARERGTWKFYRSVQTSSGPGYEFDAQAFGQARARAIEFARIILAGTAQRPGNFSCFGLHEWAMAYKSEANGIRHEYLPLRLGAQGTDEVVETHKIRCTHFDAFRFYTPQAIDLNEVQPTRETQRDLRAACLLARQYGSV